MRASQPRTFLSPFQYKASTTLNIFKSRLDSKHSIDTHHSSSSKYIQIPCISVTIHIINNICTLLSYLLIVLCNSMLQDKMYISTLALQLHLWIIKAAVSRAQRRSYSVSHLYRSVVSPEDPSCFLPKSFNENRLVVEKSHAF